MGTTGNAMRFFNAFHATVRWETGYPQFPFGTPNRTIWANAVSG